MFTGAFLQSAVALSILTGASAHAENCQSYIGEKVSPVTIEAALARFSKVTPKSEFESTKDFEARRVAATAGMSKLLISKNPDDGGKHFSYDADRQLMVVRSYAFDNANFCKDCIWGRRGPLETADFNYFDNDALDVVIYETEKTVGSYIGSNAFGKKTRILKLLRTVTAIYDHPVKGGANLFVENASQVIGEIPMSPERARALKHAFKLAFLVTPKSPYIAVAVSTPNLPTIRAPYEATTVTKVLFADIQCGLLTGPDDVVVAAFTARD